MLNFYIDLNPIYAKLFLDKLDILINLHTNEVKTKLNLNVNVLVDYLKGRKTFESDKKWVLEGFPLWLKSWLNQEIDLSQLCKKVSNFVNTPRKH